MRFGKRGDSKKEGIEFECNCSYFKGLLYEFTFIPKFICSHFNFFIAFNLYLQACNTFVVIQKQTMLDPTIIRKNGIGITSDNIKIINLLILGKKNRYRH